MSTNRSLETARDLLRWAEARRSRPVGCPACAWSGWRRFEKPCEGPHYRPGATRSYVRPCECRGPVDARPRVTGEAGAVTPAGYHFDRRTA